VTTFYKLSRLRNGSISNIHKNIEMNVAIYLKLKIIFETIEAMLNYLLDIKNKKKQAST
jgi:hypothetical protein